LDKSKEKIANFKQQVTDQQSEILKLRKIEIEKDKALKENEITSQIFKREVSNLD
jgi:hypothetical protein